MFKTRFKGHETFYFREGWLSKALFELNNNDNSRVFSDIKYGISKLGVGSNMVKSIKYWMIAANLINYKNGYHLTELGSLIANSDVYLEDDLTLWLIHYELSSNRSQATTWYLFWNYFKGESFEFDDVKNTLMFYLNDEGIDFNERSLENDITILLQMYSKILEDDDPEENSICPLARLNLISRFSTKYEKNMPTLKEEHELIVLYILLKDDTFEMSDDGLRYMQLSRAEELLNNYLNLNRLASNEYINLLKNRYLNVVNTAGLDMIYFYDNIDVMNEIRNYYEGRI